jgi:FMN phosphatase YigB (HAD superfamily)
MVTNGFRAYQYPTADALGLAGYFSGFFASDDLGSVKPFREAFDRAFDLCGETYTERHHVGDTLTQDVAGAKGAGVKAIWVHRDLPAEFMELSPRERARCPAIDALIEKKLSSENQGAVEYTADECRPDAIVAALDEVERAIYLN